MHEHWVRIERRLAALGCLSETALLPGAQGADLADLELHVGITLPAAVRKFYAVHNGQAGAGLIYGQKLLSLLGIREQWDLWRSIDEEEMNADFAEFMRSEPESVIKPMYCNRAWFPLTDDAGGNHIGLDFDPDSSGTIGQIIRFGRDEQIKRLVAGTFEAFLDDYVSWLERAQWNGSYLDVPNHA